MARGQEIYDQLARGAHPGTLQLGPPQRHRVRPGADAGDAIVGAHPLAQIHLVERAYIPAGDEAAKLDILGTDVADLIASIEHNLDPGDGIRYFQRKVAYDNLPPDYLPALRDQLAQKGQTLLEDLNDDMARHDRDLSGEVIAGPRRRAMVGIYYFEDETDDDE